MTNKMYRTCVVFVTGTAVLTVVTFSGRFVDLRTNETVVEESVNEEIVAETKAKVQAADNLAEIETQQIFSQDELEEESIVSAKEKNQLSAVTQGQEETTQQEEYHTESEEMTTALQEEQETEEVQEVQEVLMTENGTTAQHNEFMASLSLTDEERNYLLHLVAAEAGGCDLVGQILVANVVLNRVESSVFPDTVSGVIFQKNQFSPAINGSIWSSTITDSVEEAVDRALMGEDFSQGATFFSARARLDYSSMSWFDNNLNWLFKHDGHEFYSLK